MGNIRLKPAGRIERLWVPASALVRASHYRCDRLWLRLPDGRVLVFYLVGGGADDACLDELAAAVADDVRGDLSTLTLGGSAPVHFNVLYGAPVSPLLAIRQGSDISGEMLADALCFHAALDQPVLSALVRLSAPTAVWANVRNYNRLTTHAQRERRLQAVQRFPALVAPVLLTQQRYYNLEDAKRFRWRAHDDAVVAAVENGRDLVGVLARHYGISRGLVRSPLMAEPWRDGVSMVLKDFLPILDAIPANRRPCSMQELAAAETANGSHWPAFWSVFRPCQRLAAAAFKPGFVNVWEGLRRRFPALNETLIDARDYLEVLARWAWAAHRRPLTAGEIAGAWVAARGLNSLLSASLRWHARLPRRRVDQPDLPSNVPAVVGEWRTAGPPPAFARELTSFAALADEGDTMRHCVADYWDDCVLLAHRLFSVQSTDAESGLESGTALYVREGEVYVLQDLRGVANVTSSQALWATAAALAEVLNDPARAAARQQAIDAAASARHAPPSNKRQVELDAQSIRDMVALFDLPANPLPIDAPRDAHSLLPICARFPVAGYAYHAGPRHEGAFAPGQPVALVRELDNAHDPNAVRIDWQGEKIGYVPRSESADYARCLDAGVALSACIHAVWNNAPPWQRLWLEVGGEAG